ncbi:F0F1 ATP synthase subunit A [Magnetococcus marinus]|uniref:ATP synthase subunit a n=1 Tax=Magnetococcus marinus (strain ATCC BAA-1437 / JCM 17883 / MC-1) TaxID=156889 RepID=ATP6_MAGMM|nr:F0F1 ATP synthase subunit A [Magnetococcus marinus]A0LDW6.2 RecName: Full=ATP synthase subunit a; AltName: Full=ATP synthase F0 sector subunit a; AltName: Full=F-ATPase subunit 6 [Magnetococcus marinus MC-1]
MSAEAMHAAASAAPKMDPLHHFMVQKVVPIEIAGIDLSITNSTIWMWLAVAVAFLFMKWSFRGRAEDKLIPTKMQSLAEMTFTFVRQIVDQNIGGAEGRKYFPAIFTLFLLVLFCNLLGLIPGSFTPTSQLVVTATLALSVFFFATGLAIVKHGTGFIGFFVPSGVPPMLLILMVPIEIVSYLSRPVSLSVRLFANMTAGHTVLAIMFFFAATLPLGGLLMPAAFATVFTGFELFIGFIQAYIFTILTCVYINDALHLH